MWLPAEPCLHVRNTRTRSPLGCSHADSVCIGQSNGWAQAIIPCLFGGLHALSSRVRNADRCIAFSFRRCPICFVGVRHQSGPSRAHCSGSRAVKGSQTQGSLPQIPTTPASGVMPTKRKTSCGAELIGPSWIQIRGGDAGTYTPNSAIAHLGFLHPSTKPPPSIHTPSFMAYRCSQLTRLCPMRQVSRMHSGPALQSPSLGKFPSRCNGSH